MKPTLETLAGLYAAARATPCNTEATIAIVVDCAVRHGYSEAELRRAVAERSTP